MSDYSLKILKIAINIILCEYCGWRPYRNQLKCQCMGCSEDVRLFVTQKGGFSLIVCLEEWSLLQYPFDCNYDMRKLKCNFCEISGMVSCSPASG